MNHRCEFIRVFVGEWIYHCVVCGAVEGEDEDDD